MECLIDISRLMVRVGSGRLPTGVDRVCLAYLDRFSGQARGVVMRGQYRRILGYSTSRSLFKVLLNPTPEGMKGRIASEVLKSCVPPWSSQSAEGAWSFYLGHWGLETRFCQVGAENTAEAGVLRARPYTFDPPGVLQTRGVGLACRSNKSCGGDWRGHSSQLTGHIGKARSLGRWAAVKPAPRCCCATCARAFELPVSA